jgi:hypothetical protein
VYLNDHLKTKGLAGRAILRGTAFSVWELSMKFSSVFWGVCTVLAVLFGNQGVARAETNRVEVGWMDVQPCSRVSSSGENILGDWFPDTVETTEQRASLNLTYTYPTVGEIEDRVKTCGADAAAAAGIAALVSDGAAAGPTFWTALKVCLSEQGIEELSDLELSVDYQCVGW